jgi:hypothetical protein
MNTKTTNHRGLIGRPGAINVGLAEKAIGLLGKRAQSQLDAGLLAEA